MFVGVMMVWATKLCDLRVYQDKGFVWVVLMTSFLSHFVHLGFSYALLGNLTTAHKVYYNITVQESSTIGSVHNGLFCIFCEFLHPTY